MFEQIDYTHQLEEYIKFMKRHNQEKIITILKKNNINVIDYTIDKYGNKLPEKIIEISDKQLVGKKLQGKLDFMKKQGWKIINQN